LDAGLAQIQRQPCFVSLPKLYLKSKASFEIQNFQNSGITKTISKHPQQQQHQNQQQATNSKQHVTSSMEFSS
jgi:hypothetical protein